MAWEERTRRLVAGRQIPYGIMAMSDHATLHKTLHAAVKARLDIVADHAFRDRDAAAHLEALKAAATKLDRLVATLPADVDSTLRHYLERQSYTKALAWLEEA